VSSGPFGRQGWPQGHLRMQQVEDDGKSECLPVMGRIGAETIAPTRKRADFHLVICRKIGLLIVP
jgi:hypothetical protein